MKLKVNLDKIKCSSEAEAPDPPPVAPERCARTGPFAGSTGASLIEGK